VCFLGPFLETGLVLHGPVGFATVDSKSKGQIVKALQYCINAFAVRPTTRQPACRSPTVGLQTRQGPWLYQTIAWRPGAGSVLLPLMAAWRAHGELHFAVMGLESGGWAAGLL